MTTRIYTTDEIIETLVNVLTSNIEETVNNDYNRFVEFKARVYSYIADDKANGVTNYENYLGQKRYSISVAYEKYGFSKYFQDLSNRGLSAGKAKIEKDIIVKAKNTAASIRKQLDKFEIESIEGGVMNEKYDNKSLYNNGIDFILNTTTGKKYLNLRTIIAEGDIIRAHCRTIATVVKIK